MKARKEVTVRVDDFYRSVSDMLDQLSPDDVIENMNDLKRFYEGRKIMFNVSSYGYDGGVELELYETRLENNREYKQRLAEEEEAAKRQKAADEKKEANERKEYLRLKKKFEGKK